MGDVSAVTGAAESAGASDALGSGSGVTSEVGSGGSVESDGSGVPGSDVGASVGVSDGVGELDVEGSGVPGALVVPGVGADVGRVGPEGAEGTSLLGAGELPGCVVGAEEPLGVVLVAPVPGAPVDDGSGAGAAEVGSSVSAGVGSGRVGAVSVGSLEVSVGSLEVSAGGRGASLVAGSGGGTGTAVVEGASEEPAGEDEACGRRTAAGVRAAS